MEKALEVFGKELNFIKDEKIKQFTIAVLEQVPDYFWEIPASSTGKHHPSYTLGDGGLTRHVKGAVNIANELLQLEMFNIYNDNIKDCIISALLLHDCAKSGIPKSNYTVHDHPLIITKFIRDNNELYSKIDKESMEIILTGIESHMGQWNTTNYSKIVLPKPKTGIQNFIHMADYLASRKCIEINFNV